MYYEVDFDNGESTPTVLVRLLATERCLYSIVHTKIQCIDYILELTIVKIDVLLFILLN